MKNSVYRLLKKTQRRKNEMEGVGFECITPSFYYSNLYDLRSEVPQGTGLVTPYLIERPAYRLVGRALWRSAGGSSQVS